MAGSSCTDGIVEEKPFWVFRDERRQEYAERLPPIADQDLPPALRPFSRGKHPGLHFGFQCPFSRADLDSTTSFVDGVAERIRRVNHQVDHDLGWDWRLKQVLTVTNRPLYADIIVAVFYRKVDEKLKDDPDTKDRIQRVRQVLCSVFGDRVKGPEWYWDSMKHGPGVHGYIPFD
ncbi:hypothetical protein V8D89_009767, partial [Ganoderma adspersum]